MKRVNLYKPRLLLLGWLICGSFSLSSGQDARREIQRSFSTKPGMEISLINRQGDIVIESWEKPLVKLKVIIEVSGNHSELLKSKLENIDIDIDVSDEEISIANHHGEQAIVSPKGISGKYRSLGWSVIAAGEKEAVNFYLTIPHYMTVRISHEYGDLFLDDLKGGLGLDFQHGELKAGKLLGNNDLNIQYVEGELGEVGHAEIHATQSSLSIAAAQYLNIRSAFSDFQIEQADTLISSHKHNEFNIKNVGYLKMDEDYSDVNVLRLTDHGDLLLNYGGVKVDWVDPEFNSLNLAGELTNFDVKVDSNAAFMLDIDADFSDVKLPDDVILIRDDRAGKVRAVRQLRNLRNLKDFNPDATPDKKIVIITKDGKVILK